MLRSVPTRCVFAELAGGQRHDAWLMSDDAHGLGVVGGRGSSLVQAMKADVPLQMGTTLPAAARCGWRDGIFMLMKSHEFVTLLSGSAPAWPVGARALALCVDRRFSQRTLACRVG